MKRIFSITACLLFAGQSLMAQMDTTRMFAVFNSMQAKYQSAPVSFNLNYTYTSVNNPDKVLDEVKGGIELSNGNYHYEMDNTEVFSNSRYNIILFKEDKLMYLAKATTLSAVDPVQQLRTMIGTSVIQSCSVKGGIITLTFAPGGNYKELQMVMNEKTGYLSSMRYVVKTTMLMDQPGATVDPQYGEYAIVKSSLDNYKTLTADSSRFNESNFFYKEGKEFKTTADYSDYKIFIGSPNL
jgi:hypothetical protein